jgi:hypothetical protein
LPPSHVGVAWPQTPAGWDWERTQTDYITLVSPGILNTTHKWLVRARLFKLILSQSTEGWWEPSSGTAFALEARPASETENLPPSIQSRVAAMLGAAVEVALTGEEDGLSAGRHDCDWDEAVDAAVQGADMGAAADSDAQPRTADLTRLASLRRFSTSARAETVTDCPLTCSARAVASSIPLRLARLRDDDADIKTARVWCTMCVIAVLERMNNSFIWGDGCVRCMHARSISLALLTCRSSLRRSDLYPEKARPLLLRCRVASADFARIAGAHDMRRSSRMDREPRGGPPAAGRGAGGRQAAEARRAGHHALAPRLRAARGRAAACRDDSQRHDQVARAAHHDGGDTRARAEAWHLRHFHI